MFGEVLIGVPLQSAPSASPVSPLSSQHISFQELYKRNVTGKVDEKGTNTKWGLGKKLSFDTIRESLQHLRPSFGALQNERSGDPLSLSKYKSSLKLKPSMDLVPVIGGTDTLLVSVFGKEMERKKTKGETMAIRFLYNLYLARRRLIKTKLQKVQRQRITLVAL
ncbi:hypothetical protein CJ030_MR5G009646 [Morella rubra]|uniref:Uncharacterized protein n=1 Tax=Morella rubra TaxID=262757 RepID=A0A6A1VK29_9ROSI|nr:hypothetical protein CJ030_MR5G009646 [Morella rubra]